MSDDVQSFSANEIQGNARAMEVLEKLFVVAEPGAVFAEPVTAHDYTVITASEISVGMGLGFGSGEGTDGESEGGRGGGGGGGGASAGRPVAAISIGPNGVHVEPIVDPTKIAITFFTAMGAIFMAWRAMRKMK